MHVRALTCLVAVVLVAACGVATGPAAGARPGAPCHVPDSGATTSTRSYTMSLVSGAPERMYSPSQAAAQHPTEGEVMVRGTMSGSDGAAHDMGSMDDLGAPGSGSTAPAATSNLRHLEVHICSRGTGRVVSDALPTLIVVDKTAGQTTYLPVAVMQGVTAGADDLHYGNNFEIPPGHEVILIVTLSGEDAHFNLSR